MTKYKITIINTWHNTSVSFDVEAATWSAAELCGQVIMDGMQKYNPWYKTLEMVEVGHE